MIRALIIEDHQVVAEGLCSVLREDPSIVEVLWAETAEKGLLLLSENSIDFILIDINLPDKSGLELCKEIKLLYPSIPMIALSTYSQAGIINRMIENGAMGYVMKNASSEELHEAIKTVFAADLFFCKEAQEILKSNSESMTHKSPVFTKREKEVLYLIADGLTNEQIAEKLFISRLTVISHRKSLVEKTETKNTAQLVKYCFENGLL